MIPMVTSDPSRNGGTKIDDFDKLFMNQHLLVKKSSLPLHQLPGYQSELNLSPTVRGCWMTPLPVPLVPSPLA